MLIQGMYAACAYKAHHVQRAVVPTCLLAQFEERRNLGELPRLDRLGYPDEVLRHDAAGAEIQVTHFAIADLSVGKTDGETGRFQQRPRRAVPQCVPHRRLAELDGVALAARPEAPPVEHDED